LDNWLAEARKSIRRVEESFPLLQNGRTTTEWEGSSWWCRHLWGKMLSFAANNV